MQTYPKINAPFKRYKDGNKKGRLIMGDWATPELEVLSKIQWEFTEKIDGTNIRVELNRVGDEVFIGFAGRTDNAIIPRPLSDALEAIFDNKRVYEWMVAKDLHSVLLFGEGYGPKIQSGGKYTGGEDVHNFVLFDVLVDDYFWLSRDNVNDVASNLIIESVPVIGTGTIQDAIHIVSDGFNFNDRGAIVRYGRKGLDSAWGSFEAEGIVARPVVDLFDRKGNRIMTKIKAVDFK